MNANFVGYIQFQAQAGETVTITVTRPDGTTETLTTQTLPDGSFTKTQQYKVAGNYKAKAHIDEDAEYEAWDSNEETFVVALTPRTGTFTVTLS